MDTARESVRTAYALVHLPKIAAAMERGELSYAKVRALTRVACEKTEDALLQYALQGTGACRKNRLRLPPLSASRGVWGKRQAHLVP